MKFSQQERFHWLKQAVLLDKTDILSQAVGKLSREQRDDFWAGNVPKDFEKKLLTLTGKDYCTEIIETLTLHPDAIRDYCAVRKSLDKATSIILALGGRSVSIDELDAGKNEVSGLTYDLDCGFKMSVKKTELARIS